MNLRRTKDLINTSLRSSQQKAVNEDINSIISTQ